MNSTRESGPDGTGRLFSKTPGGSTKRYVYDRNLPLPQLLTAGDTTYQYGPGMGAGFGPMMQEQGGAKSWLHDDALASVRFTTNSSGTSIGSSTYDAFGSERVTSGQLSLFRFAGQEQHADIGLIHMRARWYDPAIGRFISRDPVAGSATSPQSLNPYAYVRNSPCGLHDPSGLTPDSPSAASSGSTSTGSAGAGLAARLGLSNGLGGIPLGQAVFSASGASLCFVGEIYKAVWVWKDPPAFNDPGGDLSSRLAAYWTWVDALYKWSAEMLQMLRNPAFTKVGEVKVGCGGVGRATAGLLSQVPAHVGLGLDRAGQLVGSVPPEVWVGAAVGLSVAAVVIACATGVGCLPVIAVSAARHAAYASIPLVVRFGLVPSFSSYYALRQYLGSPGPGSLWHHIVEQRLAGRVFPPPVIHNILNVVSVSQRVNQEVANYYSRVRPFTAGQTVRKWLESQILCRAARVWKGSPTACSERRALTLTNLRLADMSSTGNGVDPVQVTKLAEEYQHAAKETANRDPKVANQWATRLHLVYKALRTTNEGRKAISEFMSHPDPHVRCWAAAHSLEWSPRSAQIVLEEGRDRGGPCSLDAKWTLREFEKGSLRFDY